MIIKPLSGISIETIHSAFKNAFSDYTEPFDLTLHQLKHMIERRGCDLDLSFGAFDNDELIGFTLNGTGQWNGKRTAYDTGTGIIKDYRKKGIATRIFNESLPVLRESNIAQYLLEVIRTNTKAYDLYKKAGFEVNSELDYYVSAIDKIEIDLAKLNNTYFIRKIEVPDWDVLIKFWDFLPSWQNSIDSI